MMRESVSREEISAIEISEIQDHTLVLSQSILPQSPKLNRELNWDAAGLKLSFSLFSTHSR